MSSSGPETPATLERVDSSEPQRLKFANDKLPIHVIEHIFSHCPKSDLSSLALVCREWGSAALDALWMELNDLEFLLWILDCAWKLGHKNQLMWITYPSSDAWGRFYLSADRIRILRHDDKNWTCGGSKGERGVHLSSQIVGHLSRNAQARGRTAVLPNLRQVFWVSAPEAPDSQFVFFTPRSIQTVAWTLNHSAEENVDAKVDLTLSSLSNITPHLEELRLQTLCDVNSASIDMALATLATECCGLRRIHISATSVTQEIISSIGKLPRLEHLFIVLASPSTHPELVENLRNAMLALRPLIGLTILLSDCNFAIDWDVFRVFQFWDQLELLQITGSSGIVLTEDQVVKMGGFWKNMEVICLGSFKPHLNLPLTIAPAIAKAFPLLKHLALPVDLNLQMLTQEHPFPCFEKLESLALAADKIPAADAPRVAEFLSAVLPPGVSVGSMKALKRMVPRKSVHPDCYTMVDANWTEVDTLIKTIHRAQERAGLEIIEGIRAGLSNHTLTPEMLSHKGTIRNMSDLRRLVGGRSP